MKLMRKGNVTRFVTDKEARYLTSNGYKEVRSSEAQSTANKDAKLKTANKTSSATAEGDVK